MANAVIAVPGKRQLVGEGWSLRAERVEMLKGNDWRALIGMTRLAPSEAKPTQTAGSASDRGPEAARQCSWLLGGGRASDYSSYHQDGPNQTACIDP
jgi:hypothetical protein